MSEPYMELEHLFRVPSGYVRCRRMRCPNPPIADMRRARHSISGSAWWAYCADHLRGYNREVRDGRVWWRADTRRLPMSPDTQPTTAMEAAQKLYTTIYGMRGTEAGIRWLDCVAAALTAYAAERIGEATAPLIARGDKAIAERDAALAKLEAAEASRERLLLEHRDYVELVKLLKDRAVTTDEQVRVLEAAAIGVRDVWHFATKDVRELHIPAEIVGAVDQLCDALARAAHASVRLRQRGGK